MLLLLLACVTKNATDTCDACGGACVEASAPATSRAHTEDDVDYPDYPPMSGPHNPCWAEWGVHADVVQPENWVHNLEHGGVVIVYDPTLGADDVTTLTNWVGGLPEGRYVLTPASESFDGVVAAVSWEHRIVLGCVDVDALDTFFQAHYGKAPEDLTADPSATCGMSDSG